VTGVRLRSSTGAAPNSLSVHGSWRRAVATATRMLARGRGDSSLRGRVAPEDASQVKTTVGAPPTDTAIWKAPGRCWLTPFQAPLWAAEAKARFTFFAGGIWPDLRRGMSITTVSPNRSRIRRGRCGRPGTAGQLQRALAPAWPSCAFARPALAAVEGPALLRPTSSRSYGRNPGASCEISSWDYTQDFWGTSAPNPHGVGCRSAHAPSKSKPGLARRQEVLMRSATKVSIADPDWRPTPPA